MAHTIAVVEDEPLIAFDLADQIAVAGYDVAGPYVSVAEALDGLRDASKPDAVLLDYHLGCGENCTPIAEELARIGIPFVMMTGCNGEQFADSAILAHRPRLTKPASTDAILAVVASVLRAQAIAADRPGVPSAL